MERREFAPIAHAYRHGGAKEKAHIGESPRKETNVGHGGRCCTTFTPVAQLEERYCRKWEVASSNLAGGAFYFKLGYRVLQHPEARNQCPSKGYRLHR